MRCRCVARSRSPRLNHAGSPKRGHLLQASGRSRRASPQPCRSSMQAGERVGDGVEIGGDVQAPDLGVVAGVADDGELARDRHSGARPRKQLGGAGAPGEGGDLMRDRRRRRLARRAERRARRAASARPAMLQRAVPPRHAKRPMPGRPRGPSGQARLGNGHEAEADPDAVESLRPRRRGSIDARALGMTSGHVAGRLGARSRAAASGSGAIGGAPPRARRAWPRLPPARAGGLRRSRSRLRHARPAGDAPLSRRAGATRPRSRRAAASSSPGAGSGSIHGAPSRIATSCQAPCPSGSSRGGTSPRASPGS